VAICVITKLIKVIPGDEDKLVIYFQGGGACWDQYSTKLSACTTSLYLQGPFGIFDRKNPLNTFANYTIVHINYCSGDFFVGDVIRDYVDELGSKVTQKGRNNVETVIQWIKEQIKYSYLASSFQDLVIMGCSAGSIGSQLWSNRLLQEFEWEHAAIIPDSAVADFPKGSMGSMLTGFGYCSSGLVPNDQVLTKCIQEELVLQDIVQVTLSKWPQVPMAFIHSKADDVQIGFYTIIAVSMKNTWQKILTPEEFYYDVNKAFFGEYNKYSNFLVYFVDGIKHGFTIDDDYYTATTWGPNGDENPSPITSNIKLVQWVSQLPLLIDQSIDSQCNGILLSSSAENQFQNETFKDSFILKYCDTKVIPKHYVQH
jgi:hypothetical protein